MLALAHVFAMIFTGRRQRTVYRLTVCQLKLLGEFIAKGSPGTNFTYKANIEGNASDEELRALKQRTNAVAGIQNILRAGLLFW